MKALITSIALTIFFTLQGAAQASQPVKAAATKPATVEVATLSDSTIIVAKEKRTYTGGRKVEQPVAKSISEKGVSRPQKQVAEFMDGLFVNKALDPKQFKQVTTDQELKGMKVVIRKDHKVYRYLGDQDRIVEILQSANRPAGCTDCTTRECNGTVYECACVNNFCFCVLCVEITKLSELAE
ncbi:hypothetical protein [Chitinophaga arvensicola]|uniref:Uncharacterized protein n=1 Tax=Chitinophaga arvensicola TaxID=29529 RepID=A0A1I0S4X3_9BACT|nr:hypothetical protein [Chitinophaga arvensicola]SEW49846.1 hypothetical protein SAMN04488122_3608 [Chitinophaga arvensicola]